jgi:hypothetical protein
MKTPDVPKQRANVHTRLTVNEAGGLSFVVPVRSGRVPRKHAELPGRYLMLLRQRHSSMSEFNRRRIVERK